MNARNALACECPLPDSMDGGWVGDGRSPAAGQGSGGLAHPGPGRLLLALVASLAFTSGANGQPYIIAGSTMDGYGTSAGGLYAVNGTSGRSGAALASAGGTYSVRGDFPALPTAVLQPNRPPIARPDAAAATEGSAVILSTAKLLANDSDPDGDVLTVVSVSATSTNGGSVALAAGAITYLPLSGFTGADRFSYAIHDGREGTATADVEVIVYSGALPGFNHVLLQPVPGGFRVLFAGIPGYTYRIQRSRDLTSWETIATLQAPPHGIMEYADMTVLPVAFYRTVSP